MEFLRPFQRIDRGQKRQAIVLVIAAIGNIDRRHKVLPPRRRYCPTWLASVILVWTLSEVRQLRDVARYRSRFVLGQRVSCGI